MIHVCVPTLKRYDLLRGLLISVGKSTVATSVHIINNGRDAVRLKNALLDGEADVYTPNKPMGVAESWNWFIENVPEERFIVNDDIEVAPDSLEKMVAAKASFVSCTFGFSCFLIRDACVRAVGLFDEAISPGYAYFEDMDYLRRMREAGVADDVVQCDVIHHQSGTPQKYTPNEMAEHHRRFNIAQENYRAKWDEKPNWNHLKEIGGAGVHA